MVSSNATRSRDYLNLMAEQGHRMQRIIEDLLTLSTLESAPQPPGGERIDTAALLAQVRSEAESLIAATGAGLGRRSYCIAD
nr:histidine kinase dimerization/phospho-acceptor domain-containing protein [Rhodoferax sp.]